MCFSATASFSAGLALLVCGIAALKRAQHHERLRMIAAIPLIFGIQQIIEGFVWLSFINPHLESIRFIASALFLACAGIVWPLWIPIAISRFEQTGKYYMACMLAGGVVAVGSVWYIFVSPAVVTAHCNIIYHVNLPSFITTYSALLYLAATVAPFFISKNKTLWFLGALLSVSYIASSLFYLEAFVSVWCFFAALMSILVYGFVVNESRRLHQGKTN